MRFGTLGLALLIIGLGVCPGGTGVFAPILTPAVDAAANKPANKPAGKQAGKAAVTAPKKETAKDAGKEESKEAAARWHFNYALYLIDIGKYLEALENFDTALELSSRAKTCTEALLGKAMLLAEFLDAAEKGLEVYREIEKRTPDSAETAIYRQALLLAQLNRRGEAERLLSKYLKDYPQGRFRVQSEALLSTLEQQAPVAAGPPVIGIPELRIRLGRKLAECRVDASAAAAPVCAAGFDCLPSFSVEAGGGRLRVNKKGVAAGKIILHSSEPMRVHAGSGDKLVRGTLEFSCDSAGLLVINRINIEDYLLSVVPSESLADWPPEALKAQAVAARTYAFYQYRHRQGLSYDLVADEGDQVYGGVTREHPNGTQAVRATQGLVLTFDGQPILAMYTANSGGYTADAGSVFDLNKTYLIAQQDPQSLKGAMARWTRRIKVSEVAAGLAGIGIGGGELKDIQADQKGPSGRIIKVRLVYQDGPRVVRTRTTLARALNLPEILFEVQRVQNEFVFTGRGFGHGVGYSQWGARFLADRENYPAILAFYYPHTVLGKMW